MKVLVKVIELERKMKNFMFDEKWFPILVVILILLLAGWDSKTNIREGLLSVGFFLMGFVIGCLYTRAQFNKMFGIIKERANILVEDLVSDLSRYAIIAGESYMKTKEMIHKYKEQTKSILSGNQRR
jgi:energy-coupling factor transporter transmembrane protein EcfT